MYGHLIHIMPKKETMMIGKFDKWGNLYLKRGMFGKWVPFMCEKKKDTHCGTWCKSF